MDEFLLNMMLNIRALRNKIRPAFHPTEIEVLTALLPTRLHAEYFLETMLSFEALRAQVLHCFDINRRYIPFRSVMRYMNISFSVIHSKNSGIVRTRAHFLSTAHQLFLSIIESYRRSTA